MASISASTDACTPPIPAEQCSFTEERSGLFELKSAIKETPTPLNPTATAASSFTKFELGDGSSADGSSASVGSLMVELKDDLLTATPTIRSITAANEMVTMLADVEPAATDAMKASVTFEGKFDFASKVTVDNTMNCDDAEDNSDLRMMDSDENVMGTTKPVAVGDFETMGGMHLCISVDSDDADLDIPKTRNYMANTSYTGLTDAAFPPGAGSNELGMIDRDGTTIRITYLYADEAGRYKNRVVIRNRGRGVPYKFAFHPPAGAVASPGDDAEGMLPANSTTILLAGSAGTLVTLSGGVQTAATFTAEADPDDIDLTSFLLDPDSGAPDVEDHDAED